MFRPQDLDVFVFGKLGSGIRATYSKNVHLALALL